MEPKVGYVQWEYNEPKSVDWVAFDYETSAVLDVARLCERNEMMIHVKGMRVDVNFEMMLMNRKTVSGDVIVKFRGTDMSSSANPVWSWKKGKEWNQFQISESQIIETAWKEGKEGTVLFMSDTASSPVQYLINFCTMTQKNQKTGYVREIKRTTTQTIQSMYITQKVLKRPFVSPTSIEGKLSITLYGAKFAEPHQVKVFIDVSSFSHLENFETSLQLWKNDIPVWNLSTPEIPVSTTVKHKNVSFIIYESGIWKNSYLGRLDIPLSEIEEKKEIYDWMPVSYWSKPIIKEEDTPRLHIKIQIQNTQALRKPTLYDHKAPFSLSDYLFMEKKNHSHSLTSMNIDDVYQKVELLNHGELCEVYSCKYMMKHNKQFVALKIYDNTKVSKEEWTIEVDMLSKVSHDNCVSFLASSRTKDASYIVMELSEGQNLQQILEASESKTLEQKHAANCIYHILRGIRYLHKRGIVHANICYQNIVYHAPTNVWKICGFGSANLLSNTKRTRESFPRVKEFLAPELEKESEEPWEVELLDEWGLGIVMYLVIVGEAPWKGENREIEWDKVNNEVASSLLVQLLTENKKRLKAAEALKHRWFIEQLQEKIYFTGHIFLQD